jgi:hypothetical protein
LGRRWRLAGPVLRANVGTNGTAFGAQADWEQHREGRTITQVRYHLDPAPHVLDHTLADRQAQARAPIFGGEKWHE